MPFGYLDTQYIDFPAGIDVAYLQGLRTRAGVEFPRLVQEIDSRLGALNGGLDPLVAALITPTTEPVADTSAPAQFVVEEAGEYTIARPQLAEGSAIPLPLRKYDVSLGVTEDGLEMMSLERILLNVDSLLNGYRHLYRVASLTRLFSSAEVRVDKRSTMTSPGFAGSGTGDNVFIGPYPNGSALPGGYTHYWRDTTANRAAVLKSMRDDLALWVPGPYDLIGSATMITAITAINPGDPANGFVSAGSALVRTGTGDAEALVDPNTYIGVLYGNIRVRQPVLDFTTDHAAMFKTFGPLNVRNPLAWRWDPVKGRAAYVRTRSLYPLADATVLQWLGLGVNNRVAAELLYIAASGAYAAPTIA